jgi:hypothetical protein
MREREDENRVFMEERSIALVSEKSRSVLTHTITSNEEFHCRKIILWPI